MVNERLRCDSCGHTDEDEKRMAEHMRSHVSRVETVRPGFTGMETMEGKLDGESLASGWRAMHVTASVLWRRNVDIMEYAISRLGIGRGSRVLLMGEDNAGCGFSGRLADAVSPGGEVVDVDFRPDVVRRKFAWPLCTEHCASYPEGAFDAALFISWHHMQDMGDEVKALARVVRPGGVLVLLDHGPGHRFYRMAEEEVHVGMFAWIWTARMGFLHRGVQDLDEAYEVGKAINTRWSAVDASKAMKAAGLKDVHHSPLRGVDVVWGTKGGPAER